jgi:hypothetical protein
MLDRILQGLDEERILAQVREIGQNLVRHGKD